MRNVILLLASVATLASALTITAAAPQFGYGYAPQPAASNFLPAANNFVPAANNFVPVANNFVPAANNFVPAANNFVPAASAPQGHRGGDKYLPPSTTPPPPPGVHKQFYLISAPEDTENIGKPKHLVIGRPQKNYRVVFIKAPNSDNDNLKLSAEFAPQEEKTVIYVLSKKDNELTANDFATPAPTVPSKPEVYFIKYKTPEEAEAAQKEIQDQYDQLGGTKEFSDEGTAPVASVIGSLDGIAPDGSYNYRPLQVAPEEAGSATSPLSQYLPAAAIL